MNQKTAGATFTSATSFVGVSAGTDAATNDANTPLSTFLAICFTGVTFSGSQYYLYLSQNGLSSVAGDLKYAGPFNVANLSLVYADPALAHHNTVTEANGTFIQGSTTGCAKTLEGPIPVKISNAYKYIKVYDGSTTAVAVSLKTLNILPGITVSPTSGTAGASIVVNGGGFPSTTTIDILYQYTWMDWQGVTHTPAIKNLTTGLSTGPGYFSKTALAPDTKQALNPLVNGPVNVDTINLFAKKEASPHTLYATTSFNEWPRFLSSAFSYDNTGGIVAGSVGFSSTTFYGNDTGTTGPVVINGVTGSAANLPLINAYVKGSLGVSGNFSYSGSSVTLWVGATQIGSATSSSNGNFVVNGSIPVLPSGHATVMVSSNGVAYSFTINILPTLILTPNNGPVGTHVTATAYGFPGNSWVSLWWNEHSVGDGKDYYLGNFTVNAAGTFNVTVAFSVPHTYGGSHAIDTTTTDITTGSSPTRGTITTSLGFVTSGSFKVTPTLTISSSSFANDGKLVTVLGTGLVPASTDTGCAFNCLYQVDIDNSYSASSNQPYGTGALAANNTGDMSYSFVAAGFRPGLHVFALMGPAPPCVSGSHCDSVVPTAPTVFILFNVTAAGDPTISAINGIASSVTTAVNSALAPLSTQLTAIQSSLTSISNAVTALQTSVNAISLSGISSTLSTMNGKLDTITSTLGQVQTAASNAATQASAAATAAGNAATQATNAGNSVSSTQTYVLVVAVIAAITLVLELAILVRKLS